MEDCDLNDREFKKAVIKKLSEIEENSEKQSNKLKNKINEQKEYFTEEIETIENQTEILELKDSVNEMKDALESIGNKSRPYGREN